MKIKKILVSVMICVLCVAGLAACGGGDTASEKKESKKEEKNVTYKAGDTVELEHYSGGKYKLTINSIKETDDRNEFSDTEAKKVVIIDYTYENVDVEDELFVSDAWVCYDKAGKSLETYPADISKFPQEITAGHSCTAEEAYALNDDNNFVELETEEKDVKTGKKAKFILEW